MGIAPLYIGAFDQRIDIVSPTEDDTNGSRLTTWDTGSPDYSNVAAREVRSGGTESTVQDQVVAKTTRAWAIRKIDRTITTKMAVFYDSKLWYIKNIHPYAMNNRRHIVLECEERDND